ncbi:MAG: AAA family ATPase [Bryobacteraceae bacterium]
MPQFVFTGPWSWLSYKLGWLFEVGATKVAREARYLTDRTQHSTVPERTAWLYRCVVSCALIGAEFSIANLFFDSRMDHVLSLPLAVGVLLVLPQPQVRWPLLVARAIAVVTLLASLERAHRWGVNAYPNAVRPWDSAYSITLILLMLGLWVWVLFALRSRSGVAAVVASGGPSDANTAVRWSNVPRIRMQDVGGALNAKTQILAIARNSFAKQRSAVTQNGILLYGPQGTGKNLLAEATAGEFGVNFYQVGCPEMVGQNTGSGADRIRGVFETAAANRPIVLFLDEIDSIGSRKQIQGYGTDAGGGGREYNSLVTQLMQSIDQYRQMDGLLIVAATNYLDGLEPTLIRDGRFDARVRLDLPNESERQNILAAQLRKLRWKNHDLTAIAKRTPGWSPARLKSLVDRASLRAQGKAFEERHLIEALESTGGRDQGSLESVGWDDVVLPSAVLGDLQTLLDLMKPGRAEELSLPAPSGLILVGPPGTGKTMVARLIASQAKRSFYAVSPSDVLGSAVGGSVKRLTEIFQRAKDNAPSIVFFDEMDGLFPRLGGHTSQHDVQLVEQALIEISALKAENQIFLVGTTNYIDRIDPRILRGGRFSEKVEIPVPDKAGYQKLVARYLGKARLEAGVTVQSLAERVAGMAPADLEATIHAMKRVAMRRMAANSKELPPLNAADLDEALGRVQPHF